MQPRPPEVRVNGFARVTSFVVLLAISIAVGVVFFRVMSGFLLPLFLAVLLAVIFHPLHDWIRKKTNRPKTSALLATLLIVLLILTPIAWTLALAVDEGFDLAHRDWSSVRQRLSGFRTTFGLEMPLSSELDRVEGLLRRLKVDDSAGLPDLELLATDDRRLGMALARLGEALQAAAKSTDPNTRPIPSRAEAAATQLQWIADDLRNLRDRTQEQKLAPADKEDEAWRDYGDFVARLEVRFRRLRKELFGGALWTAVMEFANPSPEKIKVWQSEVLRYLQKYLLSLTGHTTALLGSFLFGSCIMILAVFYFFLDGPSMIACMMRLSPLDDRHEEKLLGEFSSVSRAVVLASLGSAVIQGLLCAIGYFVAGATPFFLLVALTTLLALVPFVGAAAVWVPVSLWIAFVENRMGAGIGLGIYGLLVVSVADNVIKPVILHGHSNIHPLVGLLSVLGGVRALGPIGILVGPMLVAFLQALLKMLQQELQLLDAAGTAASPLGSDSS